MEVDLDAVAAQAASQEELGPAIAALAPWMSPENVAALAAFLLDQGATNRRQVLDILRVRAGEMAMLWALSAVPPIEGIAIAALENFVSAANGNAGAAWDVQCASSGAGYDAHQRPMQNHGADVGQPAASQPDSLDDTNPADYGVLRPLLDEAKLGDPAEEGIPRRNMFEEAVRAGVMHTVPYEKAIAIGAFPKTWQDRPLAAWLLVTVRRFWAQLVTGIAGPGDCLNRLTHVALVALDSRHPSHVAERASVRYDAERFEKVGLRALEARSGDEARAFLRDSCEVFVESTATRLLEEEASGSKGGTGSRSHAAPPGRGLKDAVAAGERVCLLWRLGQCTKTEDQCGKVHCCPFCGEKHTRGGFSRNPHLGSIKQHIGSSSTAGGKGDSWGSGGQRKGDSWGPSGQRNYQRDRDYQPRKGAKRSPSKSPDGHRVKKERRSRSRS